MLKSKKHNLEAWFANSGATQHMTGQKSWFVSYVDTARKNQTMIGIGGQEHPIAGIGTINVMIKLGDKWEKNQLREVLYVPNLGRNLFSISRAARHGVNTLYTSVGCQMLSHGKLVMSGVIEDMLYRLNMVTKTPHACGLNAIFQESKADITQPLEIWHRRLKHLNHVAILKITHDGLVDGLILSCEKLADSFCEACAFGKSKRANFPQNPERKKTTSIGSLVHSDICGPLNVKLVGGSHYILIFKDDDSAYRVIYCISRKSETLSCFQDFVKTMKRETGQSV
jgi:hypothetical protein